MYFANFYVNNALHGATLANCSHFQYVSRSRLRVIQIGVKACIDVTLYDELFITPITEKYFLIPLLYPLAKLMVRYTIGLVHSIVYFIEPMTEA